MKESEASRSVTNNFQQMMWVGLGISGAARLVDAYTAPYSARRTADEALTFSR